MSFAHTLHDLQAYWSVLGNPQAAPVVARRANSVDEITQANRLVAATYLRHQFIRASDIDASGGRSLEADPHQAHSDYFVVMQSKTPETSEIAGTARQIRVTNELGWGSLPILGSSRLYRQFTETLKNTYEPNQCVEISALAKVRGESPLIPLALYKAMFQASRRQDDKLWLMACDPRLYKRLRLLFGRSITQVGARTPYEGADVIPAALDISSAERGLTSMLKDKMPVRGRIRRGAARYILGDEQHKAGVKA